MQICINSGHVMTKENFT